MPVVTDAVAAMSWCLLSPDDCDTPDKPCRRHLLAWTNAGRPQPSPEGFAALAEVCRRAADSIHAALLIHEATHPEPKGDE